MKLTETTKIDIAKLCKKHEPEVMDGSLAYNFLYQSMAGFRDMFANLNTRPRSIVYRILYHETKNEYYKIRSMQLTHSNNWLKMHGYPMKRKSRR